MLMVRLRAKRIINFAQMGIFEAEPKVSQLQIWVPSQKYLFLNFTRSNERCMGKLILPHIVSG